MVDTIYINYYLWKTINNEVQMWRESKSMASEAYTKKMEGKGWEWGYTRAHCVEQWAQGSWAVPRPLMALPTARTDSRTWLTMVTNTCQPYLAVASSGLTLWPITRGWLAQSAHLNTEPTAEPLVHTWTLLISNRIGYLMMLLISKFDGVTQVNGAGYSLGKWYEWKDRC